MGVGLGVGWQTNSLQQEPHNLVLQILAELGMLGALAFASLITLVAFRGGGAIGVALLVAALLPFISQTVLFEPAWWFAAGVLLAGDRAQESEINSASRPSSYT
jgi:O-antigen ligase